MRETKGFGPPLLSFKEDTSIRSVLHAMHSMNITSVPIYRAIENEPSGRIYLGIVSVYDILAHLVFQSLFDEMDLDVATFTTNCPEFKTYISMLEKESEFFATPIVKVLGATKESQEAFMLHSQDSLCELAQILGSGKHHVLIIDDDALRASANVDGVGPTAPPSGSSTRLISQSDLVRFLYHKRMALHVSDKALDDIWTQPVTQIQQTSLSQDNPVQPSYQKPSHKVITVGSTQTALSAYRALYMNRVSAVAVIDETTGALVATLSASDLRGLLPSTIETLVEPVFTFLESKPRLASQLKADQMRTVCSESSMVEATKSMIDACIHRVWVVGENDVPVGVVTLSDVICAFLPN